MKRVVWFCFRVVQIFKKYDLRVDGRSVVGGEERAWDDRWVDERWSAAVAGGTADRPGAATNFAFLAAATTGFLLPALPLTAGVLALRRGFRVLAADRGLGVFADRVVGVGGRRQRTRVVRGRLEFTAFGKEEQAQRGKGEHGPLGHGDLL